MQAHPPAGKPLGKDPSGFCMIKVTENRIEQSYLPAAQSV